MLFVLLLKVVWKSVIELFFCSGAASVPFAGAKVHTLQLLAKLFRKFFQENFRGNTENRRQKTVTHTIIKFTTGETFLRRPIHKKTARAFSTGSLLKKYVSGVI